MSTTTHTDNHHHHHHDDRTTTTTTTTYILVTAHPDDEAMFFVPTIHCLMRNDELLQTKEETNRFHLVCLSHGNYDGLGTVRVEELKIASQLLGFSKCHIWNDLQDHPNQPWSPVQVATNLETYILNYLPQQQPPQNQQQEWKALHKIVFLTFDYHGVSGHINHRDTFLGVQYFLSKYEKDNHHPPNHNHKNKTTTTTTTESSKILFPHSNVQLEGWQLTTIQNPIMKYFPFLDIILMIGWWIHSYMSSSSFRGGRSTSSSPPPPPTTTTTTFPPPFHTNMNDNDDMTITSTSSSSFRIFQPWKVWKAMAAHKSQFVWYRRLSVLFSRYTYFNTWKRIHTSRHKDNDDDDDDDVPKKQL